MALPQLVKERLIDREKLEIAIKKANEYRVREYVKDYFKDLKEILWILDTLPEKQVKKLFRDEDAIRLLELVERALVYLDFRPIRKYDLPNPAENNIYAEKSLMGMPENGSPRVFSISRPATDQDIERYTSLQKHIARLETFVRLSPGAIYNNLDRVYFEDLIKDAKRNGYEPAEAPETEGVGYIPKLTPEQRRFREQQRILIGLGFEIHSPEDLKALREKNRLERLREEEEYRALGVPSVEEMIESARQAPPPKYNCRKPEDQPK